MTRECSSLFLKLLVSTLHLAMGVYVHNNQCSGGTNFDFIWFSIQIQKVFAGTKSSMRYKGVGSDDHALVFPRSRPTQPTGRDRGMECLAFYIIVSPQVVIGVLSSSPFINGVPRF